MEAFYSSEVMDGIERARKRDAAKKQRIRVRVGQETYPVLAYSATGFSIAESDAPELRGLVDIFDGSRHLAQCLIVRVTSEGDTKKYEFKRKTAPASEAPVDYVRDDDTPVALLR